MSHGGGAAEPNLVPLLDMVMQLLMFFIMCVNFVNEEVNQTIQLPVAQSARPMDKTVTDVLFLNVNAKNQLEVPGEPQPLETLPKIEYYLKQKYADALQLAKDRQANGEGNGEVTTNVILRADKNADYEKVFQLMETCKGVGFRHLQLRALTSG